MRRLDDRTVVLTHRESIQAFVFDGLLDQGLSIPEALRRAGIVPSPLALFLAGVGDTLTAVTPPCVVCGRTSDVVLDSRKWLRWAGPGGEAIQAVWPDMPVDDRELLISGTHPACWDRLYG